MELEDYMLVMMEIYILGKKIKMSGLNFNDTDNKPTTITDDAYVEITVVASSSNHDYDVRELTNNLSLKSGNLSEFTGFRKKYDGQLLTITNKMDVGRTFVLKHLNEGSSSENQIDLYSVKSGQDLTVDYGCSAVLRYDNTESKWWLISYFKL